MRACVFACFFFACVHTHVCMFMYVHGQILYIHMLLHTHTCMHHHCRPTHARMQAHTNFQLGLSNLHQVIYLNSNIHKYTLYFDAFFDQQNSKYCFLSLHIQPRHRRLSSRHFSTLSVCNGVIALFKFTFTCGSICIPGHFMCILTSVTHLRLRRHTVLRDYYLNI